MAYDALAPGVAGVSPAMITTMNSLVLNQIW